MPALHRPRLLVLAPDALFRSFFDEARQRRLSRRFRWSRSAARTLEGVPRGVLAEADALVTTWDSPRFPADALRGAPRVRMIGHCGGEVKGRFAASLFDRFSSRGEAEFGNRLLSAMRKAFGGHLEKSPEA